MYRSIAAAGSFDAIFDGYPDANQPPFLRPRTPATPPRDAPWRHPDLASRLLDLDDPWASSARPRRRPTAWTQRWTPCCGEDPASTKASLTFERMPSYVLSRWTAPDAGQARLREVPRPSRRPPQTAPRRQDRPTRAPRRRARSSTRPRAQVLTHHRKARAWFQFGGHLEAGDASVWEAARREAREESIGALEPLQVLRE